METLIANYQPGILSVCVLATGILVLSLGVEALLRERFSSTAAAFFGLTLAGGIWLLMFAGMYASTDPQTALRWAKLAYYGVPVIPATIYWFAVKVLRIWPKRKVLALVFFALSFICSLTIVHTDLIIRGVHRYAWGYYPSYSGHSIWYLAIFFGIMAVSLHAFYIEFRKPHTPVHQRRVRLLLIAFGLAYLGCVDFIAKWGIDVLPIGFVGVLFFIVIAAYVLRRYRLVDVTSSFAADKIMGILGDALLVLDAEDVVRVVNDTACQLLLSNQKNIIGSHVLALDLPFALQPTREDTSYEAAALKGDRFFSISQSSIKDHLGRAAARVILIRDISAFKKMQSNLAESRQLYEQLYRNAVEPIVNVDPYGRFYSLNEAAEKLFGGREDELSGNLFVMSDLISQASIPKILAVIRNVMEGEKVEPFLVTLQTPAGERKLETHARPVKQNDQTAAVQFVFHELPPEPKGELATKLKKALNEVGLSPEDIDPILRKLNI